MRAPFAIATLVPPCQTRGLPVDYLYSLYDALVSINVPSDKARAVVDAMERDMGTTLATKQDLEAQSLVTKKDLELMRLATKQDLELTRSAMKQDLEFVRSATKQDLEVLRIETERDIEVLKMEMKQDIQLLRKEMDNRFSLVDQRFDSLESRMTVKLGSMFVAGIGLLAVMRYWT
ncbi:MAG: hypothetical protein ACREVZ_05760 [Burkholderiales bacterium]